MIQGPADGLRIMGVDPGSRVTGYGLLEKERGRIRFVVCGVIKAPARWPFAARLKTIYDGLCEVIEKQAPAVMAVEDIFVAINPRSALKLGHARGMAILAASQHGLAIHEYSPRLIKQAVVGYGQADKGQVQQMVRVLLRLSALPSQDAADALAVSYCHANLST